jgi:multidrug efflux system membrane fusion protein
MKRKTARAPRTPSNFLFSVLIVLATFYGCSGKDQGPPKRLPVPVTISTVEQKDVPVQVQAVGTVESFSSVSIKPQVGGVLQKVHFHEGQDVKKGDVLFTIDPRPSQAKLAQAQADLQKTLAESKNARAQVSRYEGLVKKDYVTKEQYDQMQANADAMQASTESAKAAVANARLEVNYCTIRSPIDGRTGNLLVHEGNVVKENDTVMLDINQVRPIYVRFSVPESQLPDIRRFNSARNLTVQALDQGGANRTTGKLSFIDNSVDRSTGTILLKGIFDNEDASLWPGEFVDITLVLTTRTNAIVIPSQAIETGQDGQFVFVVKKDLSAEQRPVTAGLSFQQQTVIEKGLSPGETVVTDGQLRLLPGSKVEIKKSSTTERASS